MDVSTLQKIMFLSSATLKFFDTHSRLNSISLRFLSLFVKHNIIVKHLLKLAATTPSSGKSSNTRIFHPVTPPGGKEPLHVQYIWPVDFEFCSRAWTKSFTYSIDIRYFKAWSTILTTTRWPLPCCRRWTWPGLTLESENRHLKHILTSREESTSTFLFRPTVLVAQVDRVECISEEAALDAFFSFLKSVGPNVVLVGMDEDTVGVLVKKLKAKDRAEFRNLVAGYSWWKRILKHTDMRHK